MMTTKKRVTTIETFDLLSSMEEQIDKLEKQFKLLPTSMDDDVDKLSTGNLALDIVLGGGIVPGGWYTILGKEQSGKSTIIMQIVLASVNENIPIKDLWDYEGSSEPTYIENQMQNNNSKVKDVKNLFGVLGKGGKYSIKPKIRYYTPSTGEKFFDYNAALLRRLPDKIKINGRWYHVFEDDNYGKEMTKGKHDEALKRKLKKLCVPAKDGKMQALVLTDSYPTMLPEVLDEDDISNAMAQSARMFSKNIPRLKSKMRSKRFTIIGVNQMRLNPNARFGNPNYEPCGEALKLNSDVRVEVTSRVIKEGKGPGQIEEEPAIDGGTDVYRYTHLKATKNKLSTPNLTGWLRLWVSDSKGKARGIDPVYDSYYYLRETGQLTGKLSAMKIKLYDDSFENIKVLKWMDLKLLILGDKKQMMDVFVKCGWITKDNGNKPFLLRGKLLKQIKEGKGIQLYLDKLRGGAEIDNETIKPDADDEIVELDADELDLD